jgi:hypothetical protein
MSQTTFDGVNVRRIQQARTRAKASPDLEEEKGFEHEDEALAAFPYLEKIGVTARKHPYAMLAGIIGAVGTVLVTIASACVILFSSFFTMYGTMREMQAQQKVFIENQAVLMSELKVMRTYNASVLSRQNFIAGLMSPDDQKRLMEFDRANPLYQQPPPQIRSQPEPQ